MTSEVKTNQTTENKDEIKQHALTYLAQGKRHLLVKDYVEAVSSLANACQFTAQLYGETANECGDVYFHYGKALLALARVENGVLGIVEDEAENEVSGGEDEDDKEEDGDDDKEDDGKENAEIDGNAKVEKHDNEKVEKDGNENGEVKNEEERDANKTLDGEESDETADNLREAWQILDLAKMIFERQSCEDTTVQLRLADVHLALGEVCLESENFVQAVEEMEGCLNIQLEHLKPDDRAIAESLYQLGLAHSLYGDYDKAAEQFRKAVDLLRSRVANLKLRASEKKPPAESETNPFYTIEGEIAEIEALVPDVEEKMADMHDFKQQAMNTMLEKVKESTAISKDGASTSSAPQPKPVSDISHLVRKKRKPEQSGDVEESTAAKEVCTEEAIAR